MKKTPTVKYCDTVRNLRGKLIDGKFDWQFDRNFLQERIDKILSDNLLKTITFSSKMA
jgi:hypothetical protein